MNVFGMTASADQAIDPLTRMIIDSLLEAIYVKDREGRYLMNNVVHARTMNAAGPAGLLGKTDFDLLPASAARKSFEEDQAVFDSGCPLEKVEMIADQETQEKRWFRTRKTPLREPSGNIVGLIGVILDVTQQKLAEASRQQAGQKLEHLIAARTAELSRKNAELTQERLLLRTLIDNLPDGIYAKDTAGRKTLANPADLKNLRCRTEAEAIGKSDFDLFPAEIAARFFADDQAVVQTGTPVIDREEFFFDEEGHKQWLLTSKLPLRNSGGNIIGLVGIGRNITALKKAEEKLEAVHAELLEVSRRAGMAEVATGVLHNVGNVLNSVNVSASVMADRLRGSKVDGVARIAQLLTEQPSLLQFLTTDERGRQVPAYLRQLGEQLEREREQLRGELNNLTQNIEHIKEIVATQQNYARVSGVTETVALSQLVDDALKIHGTAYVRHGVTVVREYDRVPQVSVDKHKVLQILVNLLSNAKYACDAGRAEERRVSVRIKMPEDGWIQVEVTDNGIGIPTENLTRIFSLGFTTRKGGHGFGLHSAALAARELGGRLFARSDGPGTGATFTLEFPTTSVPKETA